VSYLADDVYSFETSFNHTVIATLAPDDVYVGIIHEAPSAYIPHITLQHAHLVTFSVGEERWAAVCSLFVRRERLSGLGDESSPIHLSIAFPRSRISRPPRSRGLLGIESDDFVVVISCMPHDELEPGSRDGFPR
jgi:hypothetical protein